MYPKNPALGKNGDGGIELTLELGCLEEVERCILSWAAMPVFWNRRNWPSN